MLGRTNVVQRRRPTINGEVKNFVVASGNTISAGDFVSYKLAEEVKTLVNNTYTKHFVFCYDEQNEKYVVCVNEGTATTDKTLYLVQVQNGSVVILDTFSISVTNGYVVSYDVYTGDMWYVKSATVSSNTLTFTVGNVKIQSDEFVNGTDLSGSFSTSGVVTGISVPNSVFVRNGRIFFSGYVTSGSGTSARKNRYCYWAKQSGGGYSVEGSCQTSSIVTNIAAVQNEFCSMQQNDIVVLDKSGSKFNVAIINYDSVNDSYSLGNSFQGNTETNNASYVNIAYNKKYLGLSLGYAQSFVCDLQVFTVLGGELSRIVNTSVDGVYTAYGYPKVFCLKGNAFVCLSGVHGSSYENKYSKILCCEIDETDNTSVVATKYVEDTVNDVNVICSYASFVVPISSTAFIAYGNKDSATKYSKFAIDYVSHNVYFGEFGSEVESYSGNFTVGFAKTGGSAGATIQVYTPNSSS